MAMATRRSRRTRQAIRRLYDETNKGNYDFLDELLAPDFTSYGGAGFKDLHGPAAFKELTHDVPHVVPGPVVPGRRAHR